MTKQVNDKIKDVLSENLGEGYRIVRDNGDLSPMIEWVDWVPLSEDEEDYQVEVHFEDDTDEVFKKGVKLQQIWHEDVELINETVKEKLEIKEGITNTNSHLENVKKAYPSKLIAALVKDIETRADVNNLHTIKSMSTLALWLYAFNDMKHSLYFANIVSELDLTQYKNVKGFFDSAACANSYQQNSLALCTTICKETNDQAKAELYWNRYLVSRLETDKWGEPCDGRVAKKRWKRNLEKGDLLDLCITKKQSYIDNGKENRAVYESCEILEQLLWMKLAGGSELYSLERLTQLIGEQIKYLTDNIEKVNTKDFV